MATQLVSLLLQCGACMHLWAADGEAENGAYTFSGIKEPGGADDPTVCPRCHAQRVGIRTVEPRAPTPQVYGAHPRATWPDGQSKGVCWKCGQRRQLYATGTPAFPWWECGTCTNREARRANTKEMYGHGRRGY